MKENVSRQALYQRKLKSLGLCVSCSRPSKNGCVNCDKCKSKQKKYARQKFGHKPKREGRPGRPKKMLNEQGEATTSMHEKMKQADYRLTNTELRCVYNISYPTAVKYRQLYAADTKNATFTARRLEDADWSMTDKEIAFAHQVSLPSVRKYRALYNQSLSQNKTN